MLRGKANQQTCDQMSVNMYIIMQLSILW